MEYVTVSSSAAAKETSVDAASDSGSAVARYGRCGGIGYTGATSCAEGSSCKVVNDCEYFLSFCSWEIVE